MNKATLVYIGDPMCSWCWGAAPELTRLQDHYQKQLDFEIILGGLRPFTEHTMTDKQKNFLREHWVEIQEMTG